MFDRIITYLKESKLELKKVTWPTREETIRYTVTVIVISGVVAIFLGGLDYLLQFALNRFVL
ncbi:MAG: Protein translocase subunit SecE [Parcubacteria group bacterium Gr01-1014_33]|nr:MAG: Protein translocase subunit SecE [Parcubacteria group bacterium Gr01-1014_33]